ncbi:Alpha/Beta hydrolase protein [Roridomyces roridus]|uniref:Alpha/Beta hydrolase protein n=1 Tax=Roridomyces roridus TaxID=1738132 RepID=A0AAD7BKG9_9AGAR|nr:Alpha/Beta hydrolase protein [Roridomyces roridus]
MTLLLSVLSGVSAVLAFALAAIANQTGSITPLSASEVAMYRPYTYFAATGYCGPSYTRSWSCGVNCEGNPDFQPVDAGGDGEVVQYWFLGYSPSLERVIVAHEGTQIQDIVSIASDVSIIQRPLDPALFPGIPSSVRVHCGFADEQAKTATLILAAVNTTLAKYGTSTVTVVGHSLGGAIALLDAVYLQLHLPPSVKITAVTYGLPRVGNQGFADYVDAKFAGSLAEGE